jgi:hypothetical protein
MAKYYYLYYYFQWNLSTTMIQWKDSDTAEAEEDA